MDMIGHDTIGMQTIRLTVVMAEHLLDDGEGAVVTQKGQIGVNDTMAGPILSSRKGITL